MVVDYLTPSLEDATMTVLSQSLVEHGNSARIEHGDVGVVGLVGECVGPSGQQHTVDVEEEDASHQSTPQLSAEHPPCLFGYFSRQF